MASAGAAAYTTVVFEALDATMVKQLGIFSGGGFGAAVVWRARRSSRISIPFYLNRQELIWPLRRPGEPQFEAFSTSSRGRSASVSTTLEPRETGFRGRRTTPARPRTLSPRATGRGLGGRLPRPEIARRPGSQGEACAWRARRASRRHFRGLRPPIATIDDRLGTAPVTAPMSAR